MMMYEPSKRPTASKCLQHPYFQIRLPIPLSVCQDTEEVKAKPNEEAIQRASLEHFSQLNPFSRVEASNANHPTKPQQSKVKITSKELLQNARYKPGVKPLALKSATNP